MLNKRLPWRRPVKAATNKPRKTRFGADTYVAKAKLNICRLTLGNPDSPGPLGSRKILLYEPTPLDRG